MSRSSTNTTRASPASSGLVRMLLFPGVRLPVILRDAEEVLDGLLKALPSWTPDIRTMPDTGLPALCSATRSRGRYSVESLFLDEPFNGLSPAAAVCCIAADLAQRYAEEQRRFTALHCGAFLFRDRLIAVSGAARAGKSTLISRLSAEGDMRILCDDVLPLSPDGMGHGLGISPRLRLPLPAAASPVFAGHVSAHLTVADARYAYITPPTLAPYGTRAPLSALLVLSRQQKGAARIERLGPEEGLHYLLRQSIGPAGDKSVMKRLGSIGERVACYILTYADLEDAVSVIRNGMSARTLPEAPAASASRLRGEGNDETRGGSADLRLEWRRHPSVAVRRSGDSVLLWHSDHATTFHLNRVAAAIWALLGEAQTGDELLQFLVEAFPSEPERKLRTDLSALFATMEAEDLIVASPRGG